MQDKSSEANNQKPEPAVDLEAFDVKVAGISLTLTVRTESQGSNRPRRYWFSHPSKKEKDGRALRVRNESRVLIQALAETAIKEAVGNKIEMTRAEYEDFLNHKELMSELEQELHDTGLTLKRVIYQVGDPMRRLHAEDIGLTEALVAAMSIFLPETPMTPKQLLEGLLPALRDNDNSSNKNLARRCQPLVTKFACDIHHITVLDLEQLSRDCEDGKYLTNKDKDRILAKNKRTAPPIVNGREKWLSDKEIKHIEAAWGRIFIRAEAVGAWPKGKEIPTREMERRKADPPDHITIPPEDWGILLPALSKPQRLFVALSISDVRVAEMDDLGPDCIIDDANGMPVGIDVTPRSAKGKKGHKQGRNVLLTAYASALIHISRPEGDRLFPRKADEMRQEVYKLARQLGIETDYNFIRRFHDTYIHAFVNAARDQRTAYSSHSIQMINSIYRDRASFAAAIQVLTTFPADMPEYLKKWVADWANIYKQAYRGEPLQPQDTPDSPDSVGSTDGSETHSEPDAWESEEEEAEDAPEAASIPQPPGSPQGQGPVGQFVPGRDQEPAEPAETTSIAPSNPAQPETPSVPNQPPHHVLAPASKDVAPQLKPHAGPDGEDHGQARTDSPSAPVEQQTEARSKAVAGKEPNASGPGPTLPPTTPPAASTSPEVTGLSRERVSGPKTRWGRVKALPIETLKALLPRKSALEWSTRFGVSDVAIGKFCHKHGIEMKQRGEWAKTIQKVSDAEFLALSKNLTKAQFIKQTGYAPGYVKQRGAALGVVWKEASASPQAQVVDQTSK